MKLKELKDMLSDIPLEYDDYIIYNGYIYDPEIDINIFVADYLGDKYLCCYIFHLQN